MLHPRLSDIARATRVLEPDATVGPRLTPSGSFAFDAAMEPWKVLQEATLLERKWLRVRQQRVQLASGGVIDEFHLIDAPSWTAVLALRDDGMVVLVEQYRHGLGGVTRELPAGVIDEGESPQEAAARELREETGHAADDWRPILSVQTEPVRHTSRAHFFFAKGARAVAAPTPMPDENIRVTLVPVATLLEDVDRGAMVHGMHIGAILLAARRGWLDEA